MSALFSHITIAFRIGGASNENKETDLSNKTAVLEVPLYIGIGIYSEKSMS